MTTYNDNMRGEAFRRAVWTLAEWLIEEHQRAQLARATPPPRPGPGSKPTKDGTQKLINISELSRYLSVSKGSLYTSIHGGKIPGKAIVRLGRALRFDKDLIDQWIEEMRNKN